MVQRADGPAIAYDVTGEGPPIVFVHGLTSSRQTWAPVTERLTRDFTCVRVDLRGHGESAASADCSTLSLISDVRAVVDELQLGDPTVVGHSLGATVAAVYAAIHGARAVVCVDSSLRFGDFATLVAPYADALRGEHTLEALWAIELELGLEPYAGIEAMQRRVLAFPREIVLAVWESLLTMPPGELTAIAEALLPRIDAPLLSLHGSPPPPNYEAWLTGLVRRAQVEVWDGSGHMLHLVNTERFAARVGAFIAE